MTAAIPASQEAVVGTGPSRAAETGGVRGAMLLVAVRVALWVGVQLLLAGLLRLGGAAAAGEALNHAAGWWMVYGALVDLGTLAVVIALIRRAGVSYTSLLGPPAAAWQVVLGVFGVLVATAPAAVFSAEVNAAFYGDETPLFLAVIDVPTAASVFSVLVVPLLAELAESVVYLGLVLPRLERRTGRSWLAATIVVALWAAEHAFYPLLITDARPRPRVRRLSRSVAGCCRSWEHDGSSTAAPRSPSR